MTDMTKQSALFILTSINTFPDGSTPTGFYIDEMAHPYYALKDAGVHVDVASISGGKAPIDPASLGKDADRDPAVSRILVD